MLIGGLIMAIMMNARLAIILGVVIPILIVSLVIVIGKAFPRFNIMQTKIDSLNSRIQENITNTRVVKSFVRDEFEKETFNKANEDLKEKSLSAMKIVILTMPIMTLAMKHYDDGGRMVWWTPDHRRRYAGRRVDALRRISYRFSCR